MEEKVTSRGKRGEREEGRGWKEMEEGRGREREKERGGRKEADEREQEGGGE